MKATDQKKQEPKEKNNKGLEEAKQRIETATQLERSIDRLGDAIKFLDAEIGFLDIRVNFNNQDEIDFARLLGAKETHGIYSEVIKEKVIEHRNTLIDQFNNMKF